jgi:hypothetical protein
MEKHMSGNKQRKYKAAFTKFDPAMEPNIPGELKETDKWVNWKLLVNGRQTKVPINPKTGMMASTADAATWASFGDAISRFNARGEAENLSGVGRVLTRKDNLVCIDLDDCRDPVTGQTDEWATKIIQRINSYTELSPSGTGYKIWLKGMKPGNKCRASEQKLEIYGSGRFLTVTGQHQEGTPKTVEDRQTQLEELYEQEFGAGEPDVNAEMYYDPSRFSFLIRNSRGGFVSINESSARRYLKHLGYSSETGELGTSPLNEKIVEVQQQFAVEYLGPLAGHLIGVHRILNRLVLVTESPVLVEPNAGPYPVLEAFLKGLLHNEICDQRPFFYGWTKIALEALRSGRPRPGQALALAGPPNSGKSLLQQLLTILFGGRVARPYPYMTGVCQFNSDLFQAEHLAIEDEAASIDIRARRNFAAHLKQITAADVQRCNAKFRAPIELTPLWRITITLNEEPENLLVLPPIDDSIRDKIFLLKATKRKMPMPTADEIERKAFWDTLVSELPGFVHFLLSWQVPQELVSGRYGVVHYHHPEVLSAIDALAEEYRLLALIDAEVFTGSNPLPWKGRAEELERKLTKDLSSVRHEAQKLFRFNNACGVYLGRLAKSSPDRVSCKRINGQRFWTITPPPSLGGGDATENEY